MNPTMNEMTRAAGSDIESFSAIYSGSRKHEAVEAGDFLRNKYKEGKHSREESATSGSTGLTTVETATWGWSQTIRSALGYSWVSATESEGKLSLGTTSSEVQAFSMVKKQFLKPKRRRVSNETLITESVTRKKYTAELNTNDSNDIPAKDVENSTYEDSEDVELEGTLWNYFCEEALDRYEEKDWVVAESSIKVVLLRYPRSGLQTNMDRNLRKFNWLIMLAMAQIQQQKWARALKTLQSIGIPEVSANDVEGLIDAAVVQLLITRATFANGAGKLEASKSACKNAVRMARKAKQAVYTLDTGEQSDQLDKASTAEYDAIRLMSNILAALGEDMEARAYRRFLSSCSTPFSGGGSLPNATNASKQPKPIKIENRISGVELSWI